MRIDLRRVDFLRVAQWLALAAAGIAAVYCLRLAARTWGA